MSPIGRNAAYGRWEVAASLLLLGLAFVPLAPLFTGAWFPFQHDFVLSDLLHNHLPYRAELHRRLTEGQLPQWWPHVFSGTPFWAQPEASVLWPPNLIASYFLSAPSSLNAGMICSTGIGALSGWYYARVLGARPLVGTVAGIAWALSGGMVSHLKHPNLSAAVALMPVMFATLEQALRSRRSFAWFGLAVCSSLITGMPQVTWVTLIGCALRALAWWAPRQRRSGEGGKQSRIQAAALGFATALGIAGAAVVLLPTLYFNSEAVRAHGLRYEDIHTLDSPLWDYLSLFLPLGRAPYATLSAPAWESWFYQGLVITVGAALGWRWLPQERRVTYAVVAVTAAVLGLFGPIQRLAWHVLPGMNFFRFHQRFFLLVALMILTFAIHGIELGLRRLPANASRRWQVLLPLGLALFTVFDLSVSQRDHLRWERWRYWTRPGIAEEVVPAGGRDGRLFHIDEYGRMLALTRRGPSDDPATYRALGSVPLGSLGALHDLWTAGGYTNLVQGQVAAYFKVLSPSVTSGRYQPAQWEHGDITPAWHSMLDRAHVTFILTSHPLAPAAQLEAHHLRLLRDGPTRVLRNESALPRAYVARRWHDVHGNAEAAAYMQGPGADDPRVPTIDDAGAEGGGAASPTSVPVQDVTPEEVALDLSQAPAGWLVLTDSNEQGWSATLDGREVPIHDANGYQRAVYVSAEAQRLVFHYRTPGLVSGAAASLTALLALLAWLLAPRLRRWRRTRHEIEDGLGLDRLGSAAEHAARRLLRALSRRTQPSSAAAVRSARSTM